MRNKLLLFCFLVFSLFFLTSYKSIALATAVTSLDCASFCKNRPAGKCQSETIYPDSSCSLGQTGRGADMSSYCIFPSNDATYYGLPLSCIIPATSTPAPPSGGYNCDNRPSICPTSQYPDCGPFSYAGYGQQCNKGCPFYADYPKDSGSSYCSVPAAIPCTQPGECSVSYTCTNGFCAPPKDDCYSCPSTDIWDETQQRCINKEGAIDSSVKPAQCDPNTEACKPGSGCYHTVFDLPSPSPQPCKPVGSGSPIEYNCDTAVGNILTSPKDFVQTIMGLILSVVGGVAILLIMLSGYRLMVSQGNPENIKSAKEQLTAAIIGLLFIIFSLVILQVIGVNILGLPGFN